ncbi:MAG: hemerythrin domain-containing protein [Spirochaetes bacterium]|nr:hemerythrin domain-containing protein [Spirochaetota bacterium]
MGIAVDHIREDHDYIMKSLGISQKIFMKSEDSEIINKIDLSECIRFNAIFTDMCHKGKEETILFKNLTKKENGLIKNEIDTLTAEHKLCRIYIKNLQNLFPENPYELISPRFITSFVGYINHMESHIEMESEKLFTIIDHYLSDSEQENVCIQFDEYEKYVMEACDTKYIKNSIDYLFKKYS